MNVYLCQSIEHMELFIDFYSQHFESRLSGRYITLNDIEPLLDFHKESINVSVLGLSERQNPIYMLEIGKGKKRVFGWSQMHGNESTCTKAIFDFLGFLTQKEAFQEEIRDFLENYTLGLVPMLNPDGAELYTRENANSVDLNRDAQSLSQPESQVLGEAFNTFQPDLCLNLHDQRTIYGLTSGLPATISFLAPSADLDRSITEARKIAMLEIAKMNETLQDIIPGQIGRYDDGFNVNCVGDTFQLKGVPTILFEAGHFQEDYHREKSREFVFYAFLSLFSIHKGSHSAISVAGYAAIPENQKNLRDLIIRNVKLKENQKPIDLAIQFEEVLRNGEIQFIPCIDSFGDLGEYRGHREISGEGEFILVNSQKNIEIGDIVSDIVKEKDQSSIFLYDN